MFLHILVPRKEWIVIPPILIAATPVEAVKATSIPSPLAHLIKLLIVYDFPVPAWPVKNILSFVFILNSIITFLKYLCIIILHILGKIYMIWKVIT